MAIQVTEAKPSTNWGMGHSLILAGAAILVAVVVLWILALRYLPGNPYEQMTHDQIRAQSQRMSPVDTWETWLYFQQFGINPHKDRMDRLFEGKHEQRQMLLTFLGLAAVGGIALMAAGLFVTRRSRSPSSPGSSRLDKNE